MAGLALSLLDVVMWCEAIARFFVKPSTKHHIATECQGSSASTRNKRHRYRCPGLARDDTLDKSRSSRPKPDRPCGIKPKPTTVVGRFNSNFCPGFVKSRNACIGDWVPVGIGYSSCNRTCS
jgi:hypothetical protein